MTWRNKFYPNFHPNRGLGLKILDLDQFSGSLAISDSAFSFHLCNSCSTSYLGAPWAFRLIAIIHNPRFCCWVVEVNESPNNFPQRLKAIVSFLSQQLGVWPSQIVCWWKRTWWTHPTNSATYCCTYDGKLSVNHRKPLEFRTFTEVNQVRYAHVCSIYCICPLPCLLKLYKGNSRDSIG